MYPPGTVFVAMYGQGKTRGQTALLEIEATTTQNTAAIIPTESLDSTFLWLYLMSRYEALRQKGHHGQISHLNLVYMKELQVPLPSMDEQQTITSLLMNIEGKLEAEEKRKQALDALFQSLLHHLMTGKVRLPEFA